MRKRGNGCIGASGTVLLSALGPGWSGEGALLNEVMGGGKQVEDRSQKFCKVLREVSRGNRSSGPDLKTRRINVGREGGWTFVGI